MEEPTGPRRRPPQGGYARGDAKRLKIIEVALTVFGDQGYDQASTRQIARDAGVNPPALQYYFAGKAGLHLACVEHIAAHLQTALEPVYAAADAIAPDAPPARVADALCAIMDTLADYLFGGTQLEGWSRFIARSAADGRDGPPYDALRRKLSARLHRHSARLIGIATGLPATDPRTKLRSLTILGQLRAVHMARDIVLEYLDWPDVRGERLALLKSILHSQVHAILAPAPAPRAGG